MTKISTSNLLKLKTKAPFWINNFDTGLILDSNACMQPLNLQQYEFIVAAGVKQSITCGEHAFENLKRFNSDYPNTWKLGYISYDVKNQLEKLTSDHTDEIGFNELSFFIPQYLIVIDWHGNILEGEHLIDEILALEISACEKQPTHLKPTVTKQTYIEHIESIRNHIINGDVYELNYCTAFYAENVQLNAPHVYNALHLKSPVPFGCFLKDQERYLLGASPERFLTKRGTTLYSQPIKGTAKRDTNADIDNQHKHDLLHSDKERAENLMIVDLVRNDLARSAQTGSVKVEELFGIYTFPQVHQMISTVSAKLKEDVDCIDAIANAFPMGSMTGAPKIMAMKLIEQYEQTKRGLYSGTIGYINPEGDFDFNVVIRSIQYNAHKKYLNFEVGSAITYDSNPEAEYAECLLKAEAMLAVL